MTRKWAVQAVVIAGMLNFVAFVIGASILGGDALNTAGACPPDGHYIWVKNHVPPCVEVSPAVDRYSRIHAYSVLLSWPFVMAGTFYLNRRKRIEAEEARNIPRDFYTPIP